jgi:hypothetical protein
MGNTSYTGALDIGGSCEMKKGGAFEHIVFKRLWPR